MKLKAKHSINGIKPKGQYLRAGEEFDVDDKTGQALVATGAAEEIPEEVIDAETAQAKAKLIMAIAAAATAEDLDALVPHDETDEDILDAFDARMDELMASTQKAEFLDKLSGAPDLAALEALLPSAKFAELKPADAYEQSVITAYNKRSAELAASAPAATEEAK